MRALYGAYNGPLYQLRRASDSTTKDVAVLAPGGFVNVSVQDTFCSGTTCTISILYDQSPNHNHLTKSTKALWLPNGGNEANAADGRMMISGHVAHGIYVNNPAANVGYRNNATSGVATGSKPAGMYMVTEGTHTNNRCCFDYGNAETSGNDTGNGHMDAINFGTECWFSPCSGSGPWVQADLENGLFAGANGSYSGNTGRSSAFVTAMLKNNGTTTYAIKDGNAQSGSLATRYSGALPNIGGYTPMHLEGAIVLGTGGDNSNGSVGSFFEGVMTSGYPTDAAESSVQSNIVSVGYSKSTSFPVAGTAYRITNVNSGKVLDAINCGTANGTKIALWASLGNTCQQWKFASTSNGDWIITNVNSGTTLDSVNCGWADGTAVDLWSSLGNLCQRWSVIPTGGGRYELVVATSGMALDAVNCGTANGTLVDQWQWINNTCQEWTIAA